MEVKLRQYTRSKNTYGTKLWKKEIKAPEIKKALPNENIIRKLTYTYML